MSIQCHQEAHPRQSDGIENGKRKHTVAPTIQLVNNAGNISPEKNSTEITRKMDGKTYNAKGLLYLDITCKIGATGSN